MKIDNTLLDKMLTDANLMYACERVVRNGGSAGVDGMQCNQLKEYLQEHLEEIKEQIRNRKYKPQPVRRVEIPKDDGGTRYLGIPTVIDRFVQLAIVQVLEPIYEPKFSEHSYGFRPNRSAHMAIEKVLELLNGGYEWVVDIDLEKFFDNVHHDKLISLLMKDVKSGEIISLIRKFLRSGIQLDDGYKESTIGTPQGGNLSPLLSNIMLNELDKELEARGLNFARYADDCIILVHSSKAADRVMSNVTKFIENKLGLKVNMTKSKISKPNNIKYLGFGFFRIEEVWKAKPHVKSVQKIKMKLKELTKRNWSINMDTRLRKIRQVIVGWVNYYRIGMFKEVARKLDGMIRFRLRMCIWKQWKRVRTKFKALQRLGITRKKAWMWANSRKGYARCASTFLKVAITNRKLEIRGLTSMLAQYQYKHV